MARGRGVRLQKYPSAALSDCRDLRSKAGLTWKDFGRPRPEPDLERTTDWRAIAPTPPPRACCRRNLVEAGNHILWLVPITAALSPVTVVIARLRWHLDIGTCLPLRCLRRQSSSLTTNPARHGWRPELAPPCLRNSATIAASWSMSMNIRIGSPWTAAARQLWPTSASRIFRWWRHSRALRWFRRRTPGRVCRRS